MPIVPDPSTQPSAGWVADLSCCDAWSTYTPAVQDRAYNLAVFTLWALTGRQYGFQTVVAKPCNAPRNPPLYQTYPVNLINPWGTDQGAYYAPYIINGEWHNAGCAGINCCKYFCGTPLDGPVAQVDSVVIDGATLDPSAYQVFDGWILKRTDGDCWPFCTDTFVVTYQRGYPPPAILSAALGTLMCQYALACVGSKCMLPARMTSLTRQGVSAQFAELDKMGDLGLTNIASVDRVVALLNPNGLMQAPVVSSPDVEPIRYQTWP